MSRFLVNLARRGAGFPLTTVQAPPLSPFGPEIRKHGDVLTGDLPTGKTASQGPLAANPSEGCMNSPSEPPAHIAPFEQRLSKTEPSTSIQPSSVGETAANTPSLEPTPLPRRHVTTPVGEVQTAPMEPPKHVNPSALPVHSNREVIAEINVEYGHSTTTSAAQTDKPMGEGSRLVRSVASGPPMIIREPAESQAFLPLELSADQPRDGAQKTRKPALSAPKISPAPAESFALLQFPKATPASSTAPPAQLPVHVRIGRVEVRAAAAPTPTPARPSAPAPLGFEGYYRVRNYRR